MCLLKAVLALLTYLTDCVVEELMVAGWSSVMRQRIGTRQDLRNLSNLAPLRLSNGKNRTRNHKIGLKSVN
jgi:hypothetical protein